MLAWTGTDKECALLKTMLRLVSQFALTSLCAAVVCLGAGPAVCAQGASQATISATSTQAPSSNSAPPNQASADSAESTTLFPHSETKRWWLSGQGNIVFQWHPDFPAAYSGPNSLRAKFESATSKVYTLYLGYQLGSSTEVYLDMESAGGHGISDALGLAGETNLDVVRNPDLSQNPYVARLMIREIIPLSRDRVEADRDALHLATSLPARRLELRAGKFGVVDFTDVNTFGSDSHLQFLNWTIDNNGAYDYAANTRGYTDGVLLEYDDHWFAARFTEALMPKVANGINLDADVARSRAENLEFEAHGGFLGKREGTIRLLSYLNTADMGNYRQAIVNFEQSRGAESAPDIVATRRQGRHKYGFGLNFEQEISPSVGIFGRLGWSDGRNESFAYTEVDRTGELGAVSKGSAWKRENDRAGVVVVANGIVAAHQQYLALGGLGFLLGDGGLTYGPEKVVEAFYTAHLWSGLFASFDVQHINNPGYNKARGPVIAPAVRFHFEF